VNPAMPSVPIIIPSMNNRCLLRACISFSPSFHVNLTNSQDIVVSRDINSGSVHACTRDRMKLQFHSDRYPRDTSFDPQKAAS